MIIRKAKTEDVPQIVEVHTTTWKICYRGYIPDEILDSPTRCVTPERIEKMKIPVQEGLVYVAEENGHILGFLGLQAPISKETEIKVFYVYPSHQRKGIGKALFQYVLADLKQNGCQNMFLWTMTHYPPSNQFYTKMGCVRTNEQMIFKSGTEGVKYTYDITKA